MAHIAARGRRRRENRHAGGGRQQSLAVDKTAHRAGQAARRNPVLLARGGRGVGQQRGVDGAGAVIAARQRVVREQRAVAGGQISRTQRTAGHGRAGSDVGACSKRTGHAAVDRGALSGHKPRESGVGAGETRGGRAIVGLGHAGTRGERRRRNHGGQPRGLDHHIIGAACAAHADAGGDRVRTGIAAAAEQARAVSAGGQDWIVAAVDGVAARQGCASECIDRGAIVDLRRGRDRDVQRRLLNGARAGGCGGQRVVVEIGTRSRRVVSRDQCRGHRLSAGVRRRIGAAGLRHGGRLSADKSRQTVVARCQGGCRRVVIRLGRIADDRDAEQSLGDGAGARACGGQQIIREVRARVRAEIRENERRVDGDPGAGVRRHVARRR